MLFLIGVVSACLAAVAYGMSTVLRALGARRVAQADRERGVDDTNAAGGPTLTSTMSTLVDPSFILGTVMVVIGFAGGAIAARFLPLFLSQTIVSANLIVTALLGTIMLNIALHTRDWVAIWLVVLSLCLLGFSSSTTTGEGEEASIHWGLFLTTLVVAGLALAAVYKLGKHGAIVGGAMSGLLFGIIAISVRILDGVHPFEPTTLLLDPAAWTIAVAGAVGFFVQTVALQLGAVNGVTAALVVGETAGPSLVGVVFLGDTAKAGLGWLAVVGFIGAFVGAVLVAWYGSGDPDHFGEAPPMKGGWRRGREDDYDDEVEFDELEAIDETAPDVPRIPPVPDDAAALNCDLTTDLGSGPDLDSRSELDSRSDLDSRPADDLRPGDVRSDGTDRGPVRNGLGHRPSD